MAGMSGRRPGAVRKLAFSEHRRRDRGALVGLDGLAAQATLADVAVAVRDRALDVPGQREVATVDRRGVAAIPTLGSIDGTGELAAVVGADGDAALAVRGIPAALELAGGPDSRRRPERGFAPGWVASVEEATCEDRGRDSQENGDADQVDGADDRGRRP